MDFLRSVEGIGAADIFQWSESKRYNVKYTNLEGEAKPKEQPRIRVANTDNVINSQSILGYKPNGEASEEIRSL